MLRATLTMREPRGCRQIGDACVVAPDRPVVAAVDEPVLVRQAERGELACECRVLLAEVVGRARVEPEVRAKPAQARRGPPYKESRVVRRQELEVRTEDRAQLVRLLVSRPALDDGELAWVVNRYVDRAVAALREPRDRAAACGRDRPVVRVDVANEIAGDEGRPTAVRGDSVHPLLVVERPGLAERHDEDDRLGTVARRQGVVDDPDLD